MENFEEALNDYALYEREVGYYVDGTMVWASKYRLASVLVGVTASKAMEIVDKLSATHSDLQYELERL